MKKNCKVCGNNCYGEHCMRHKPRKALKKTIKEKTDDMSDFFDLIWRIRPHRCQSCGEDLGNEPRTYMFDHLLDKSKYPEFKFDRANIFICCLQCHSSKTNGHPTESHQAAINAAKALFLNN